MHTNFEEIVSEVNTNLLGAINIAKASHKYLKESKGSLVLFTSSSYTRGRAGYSLYSSTKAAIVNLTQALASEWQKDNIRVNAMCPERTKTSMRKYNFGKENSKTLLKPSVVAKKALQTAFGILSGLVIDIKNLG